MDTPTEQFNPKLTPIDSSVKKNSFASLFLFFAKNKYSVLTVAIVALFSFGSTAFILANQTQKTQVAKRLPTVLEEPIEPTLEPTSTTVPPTPTLTTPVASPSPTIDTSPTATWSAYINNVYKYSVKYPPDWTAKTTSQSDPKILEYIVFNPKDATASATSITFSYSTRTLQEALAIYAQTVGEQISVATVSATRKKVQDSSGNISYQVIVPTGTKTLILYAKEKYKYIFDLMLSTFAFLN